MSVVEEEKRAKIADGLSEAETWRMRGSHRDSEGRGELQAGGRAGEDAQRQGQAVRIAAADGSWGGWRGE